MKFYTNVARQYNSLFVRGYENGRRFKEQIEYNPYIFVSSPAPSEYKTLSGRHVDKFYPG